MTTQSGQWSSWTDPNTGAVVNNDVWNPGGSWSQTQSICSSSSWNVTASFPSDPGQVQAYPDTEWTLNGTTPVSGYSSIWQCFGATAPAGGGYLDFGIDDWVGGTNEPNNSNTLGSVEVMVQNKYTNANPAGARAVTIDGYPMHEFQGGGANEWVYTLDNQPDSGCVNMVDIFNDLAAHPGTSGMTTSLAPGQMLYGIEMEATNGTENYAVTDATLTATTN